MAWPKSKPTVEEVVAAQSAAQLEGLRSGFALVQCSKRRYSVVVVGMGRYVDGRVVLDGSVVFGPDTLDRCEAFIVRAWQDKAARAV